MMLPTNVIDCEFGVKVPPESKVKLVTVSGPPVMSKTPPESMVIEPTPLTVAVFVTELPVAMTTSDPAGGTVPPGHGAFGVVEFQFPLPAVVMVAARPMVVATASAMTAMMVRILSFFIGFNFIDSGFVNRVYLAHYGCEIRNL